MLPVMSPLLALLAPHLADAAWLVSPIKPVLLLLTFAPWAWFLTRIDKDAAYYYLPRDLVNLFHLGVGTLTLLVVLAIPIFWLGWPLAILMLAGSVVGYAAWRNQRVPAEGKWTFSLDPFTQRLEARQQAAAQKKATLRLGRNEHDLLPVPTEEGPARQAYEALQEALLWAIPRGAERVDLLVDSQQAQVTGRIDGVAHPHKTLDPRLGVTLIDYVKAAAGLDVNDRRKLQRAELVAKVTDAGTHKLDLTTAGSTRGVQLTLKIDARERILMGLDRLGLLGTQRKRLDVALGELGEGKAGVVLVAAGAGQGTSTTLYALLQRHDPYTQSVVTLEDAAPARLEGVDHNTLPSDTPPDKVRDEVAALLRSDPDVLLVSKLWPGIPGLLAGVAESVRVYAPMAGSNTSEAANAWLEAVGDREEGAAALRAVIAQRLMRKLCTNCRVAYTPDPAAIKKLNLPVEQVGQLYQASGKVKDKEGKDEPCPQCHGVGYRGRVGVFEVMTLDHEGRKLLAKGDDNALRSHLRRHKMLWLQEAALAKVVEGVTDIKEATRAMNTK